MQEKYTIENIKNIFNNIIEEEQKENNIIINGNIFTLIEYYKSEIFKKRIHLCNPQTLILEIIEPIRSRGWYNQEEKQIVVLVDTVYGLKKTIYLEDIAHILTNIYHEIRHRYQEQKLQDAKQYNNFIMSIEKIIIKHDEKYYLKNHNKFLSEIDAEQYAYDKTTKYLKEKTTIYNKNKPYLDKFNDILKRNIYSYDPRIIFERFNYILQEHIKMKNEPNALEETIKEIIKNKNIEEYNTIKKVLTIIYNSNGTYKSIQEIINNSKEIDQNIIKLVISSESFIKNLDITTITEEEKKYLLDILKEIYINKINQMNNLKIINEEMIVSSSYKPYNIKLIEKELEVITSLTSQLSIQTIEEKNKTIKKK